jgi:hypothetical protein
MTPSPPPSCSNVCIVLPCTTSQASKVFCFHTLYLALRCNPPPFPHHLPTLHSFKETVQRDLRGSEKARPPRYLGWAANCLLGNIIHQLFEPSRKKNNFFNGCLLKRYINLLDIIFYKILSQLMSWLSVPSRLSWFICPILAVLF